MSFTGRLSRAFAWTAAWAGLSAVFNATLSAQSPGTIEAHTERARIAAGSQWAEAAKYFCAENSMPNRPTDPAIEPTRLFDNLSVIGSVGTAVRTG